MIDEFPVTIEHIRDEQGEQAARNFLKQNRSIRQNDKYNQKIKFIYTGSIGLLSVVKKLSATADVNDIQTYKLRPLSLKDALELSQTLLENYQIAASDEALTYLLKEKIEWLIPFHIQLAIKEIRDLHRIEAREVNRAFIDRAFNELVLNGSIYLEHYGGAVAKGRADWIVDLAVNIASRIFQKYPLTLEYDGYIAETNGNNGDFIPNPQKMVVKKCLIKN